VAHLTQHTPAWVAERTSVFQETLVRSPDSPALAGPAQQTTAPFVDTHGQTPESTPVTLRRDDATTSQVETGGRRFNAPWVGAGVLSITAVVLAMIYFPRGTTNAPQKPSGIPSVEPSKKNHAAVNPSPGGSKSDQSGGAARNNLVIDQTTPAKTANSNEAISIDPIPSFTKLPDGGIEVALNSSGTAMRFVRVPSGEFEMGSRDDDKEAGDDERPQHLVRIRRAFYLGAHEVTRCEFRAFVQATNYTTEAESDGSGGGGFDTGTGGIAVRNARFSWQNVGWPSTERHPVVNVTWDDAKRFCQWLAMRVGRPCRLPTEAEWEYACRAGTTTRYSFGDNEADLATHANVLDGGAAKQLKLGPANLADDRFRFAAPCAEFPAKESPAMNAFKLFDMHGNVAEWCEDGYDAKYYQKRIVDDPLCQPIGDARVLRGGSWGMPASYARSAARLMFMRDGRNDDVGFRVVIEATDE
jgi:formylglycine-generating enzyme required for sulfatase activity